MLSCFAVRRSSQYINKKRDFRFCVAVMRSSRYINEKTKFRYCVAVMTQYTNKKREFRCTVNPFIPSSLEGIFEQVYIERCSSHKAWKLYRLMACCGTLIKIVIAKNLPLLICWVIWIACIDSFFRILLPTSPPSQLVSCQTTTSSLMMRKPLCPEPLSLNP